MAGFVVLFLSAIWLKDSVSGWLGIRESEPARGEPSALVQEDSKAISPASLDGPWPLTVPSGTLTCHVGNLITFSNGGATYAINGLAEGHADERGWRNIEAIWLDDPATGAKMSIGALIDSGEFLCRGLDYLNKR